MNLTKSFALLFFSFLLLNCSKDETPAPTPDNKEEPKPEVYFTLNVDSDKDTSDIDNWLIIHDSYGKLLDFKPYESGSKLVFEANKDSVPDKITITKFVYSKDYVDDLNDGTTPQTQSEIGVVHTINTYTQIEKGSIWDIKAEVTSNYVEPIESGKFHLSIDSIPQMKDMSISTKKGGVHFSYSIGSGTNLRSFDYNLDKFQDEDEYLVAIMDGHNDLKYKNFFVSEDVDSLFLKYSEFREFDKYFEVDVPDNIRFSLNIRGFDDMEELTRFGGYRLLNVSENNYSIETKPLKYGYINRFNKFRTVFNVKTPNFYYQFHKYGEMPSENIIVPNEPNLVIENPSLYDFRFSSDKNYEEMVHLWSHIEGPYPFPEYSITRWSVTTSSNHNPVVGNIPTEIIEKYPKIDLEKIEYSETYINLLTNSPDNNIKDREGITIYKQ